MGGVFFEVPVGIEPTIEVLQTPALPLGYGTVLSSIVAWLLGYFKYAGFFGFNFTCVVSMVQYVYYDIQKHFRNN